MDVGKEVRRLREAKGWSQAKLAGAAGMGVSGISQIETGARNPSAVTLAKIAESLGVGVADLFPLAQAALLYEPTDEQKAALNIATHWIEFLTGMTEHWERTLEREDLGLEDVVDLSRLTFDLQMLYILEEDLVRAWCTEENEERLNAAEEQFQDLGRRIDALAQAKLQEARKATTESNVADLTEKINARRAELADLRRLKANA